MTSPTVTELRRRLEPITADTFADGLVEPAPRRLRARTSLGHTSGSGRVPQDGHSSPALAAVVVVAAVAAGPVIVDPDVAGHAVNVAVVGAR